MFEVKTKIRSIYSTSQLTVSKASLSWLLYHIYTLYLFTASDFITVLWPQTFFAISVALNPSLNGGTQSDLSNILPRVPSATLWIWLQLLVLDVSNQRRADSVAEDALNKPWRPLPSGRLERRHAKQLLLCCIPISYALSQHLLGGGPETVALFVLNWIYNDLGAAENWILRNVLNALGITSIGAGATAVVAGGSSPSASSANGQWLLICAGILLTTIQAQDLYDQEGDGKRGRRTMPLVLGDGVTRWLTAGPVVAWSFLVPGYWRVECLAGWLAAVLPGFVVAVRLLRCRDVVADRRTFKIWAVWMVGLYAMPAIKASWG
ncbi:UbiA prenyltransferase family-domain-containing protein [Massariosphaeria phaeospora]|uniref:UbiA prenyltransferase family-domain-containing protein n=1 Tax=Massariosphaeria phaeospora TaxID=100035 RepID=A0A7C8I2M7_9PLEO|nr:UbiA prenyltransferase family-domain-containing protein [Massariosphaeria phaeospora]